jgi:hypothetical protein
MRHNEFSYEQTGAMRTAIDMVLAATAEGDGDVRRSEIARIVLSIADQDNCEASTLAKLTLERLGASGEAFHAAPAAPNSQTNNP